MRKQRQSDRSHVTNRIVANADSYTAKVWPVRGWIYLQSLRRGRCIAILLKGDHLPAGTLRVRYRQQPAVRPVRQCPQALGVRRHRCLLRSCEHIRAAILQRFRAAPIGILWGPILFAQPRQAQQAP